MLSLIVEHLTASLNLAFRQALNEVLKYQDLQAVRNLCAEGLSDMDPWIFMTHGRRAHSAIAHRTMLSPNISSFTLQHLQMLRHLAL